MKRLITLILFSQCYLMLYGQIIADHTIVDHYDNIPQKWIDSVKTMWLNYAGRSHSLGVGNGMVALEALDATFDSRFIDAGSPAGPSENWLRVDRATWGNYDNATGWQRWHSEASWWTNSTGIERTKAALTYANSIGNPVSVFGFGHSYEFYASSSSATADPVTGNRWYGWSAGSPSGSGPWGLDDADNTLTGNDVNLDDYLAATEEYIAYCADSIPTTVIFTTGPVESDGITASDEALYSGYLKNEYIRNYVAEDNSRILFDYGDILCYNNAGEEYTATWDSNTFPTFHPDNLGGDYTSHIGTVGAVRLAKAMWWMLARIAGWDGAIDGEDTMPPTAPSGLILNSASLNSITITWSASSDNVAVTGYNVFRNGVFIGTTSEPSYSDNTLTECDQYTYTVSAFDGAGNESGQSQGLLVSNCHPDLTPTLIVSPNISHGITAFNVLVRVTELNNVISDGPITVNIPADSRWDLDEGYNSSLEMLNDMALNNSDWTYSRDGTNHIFSSSVVIPAGNSSTFGFTIVFNPDTSRGLYTVTSQLVPGSGGEIRSSNNADSERLDYFQ